MILDNFLYCQNLGYYKNEFQKRQSIFEMGSGGGVKQKKRLVTETCLLKIWQPVLVASACCLQAIHCKSLAQPRFLLSSNTIHLSELILITVSLSLAHLLKISLNIMSRKKLYNNQQQNYTNNGCIYFCS